MFFETLEGRQMMVADAINDAGTTNENTILTTVNPGATTSLMANDTGTGITVVAFSSTSAQGATVNINPTGSFSYNPNTSTSLQALGTGQNLVDTFSYVISEGPATNGFQVRTYNSGGQGDLNAVDAFLAAPPAPIITATVPTINFFQTDGVNQHFIGAGTASTFDDETTVPGLPAGDQNNYIIEALGSIYIPAPGRYTFSVNSDDGFGLAITGGANLLSVHGQNDSTSTLGVNGRLRYSTGRGTQDTFGVWDFPTAGVYPLRLVNWEGGGGSSVEMYAARGDFTGTDFNTAQAAGAQWRLVGDTFDTNGIRTFSPATSVDGALVSVTVTGLNAGPVANANSYATSEDTAFTVTGYIEVPGVFLETYRAPSINDTMVSADNARATLSPVATATELFTDMYDPEGHFPAGNFPNNIPFPGNTAADDNNYAVFGTGVLRVLTAGTYTFGTSTDDNSRIRIDLDRDGMLEGNLTALGGSEAHPSGGTVAWQPGCCGNVIGPAVTLAAGDYRYEVVYTEGGGGSSGEFFYAAGAQGAFNANFRLIGDSSQGIASFAVVANPGVLGNDTDEEATNGNVTQTLAVTQLNGGALTGTTSLGAQITLNPNGGFTYNPNVPGSQVQALSAGQIVADTFSYTVSDNAPGGALTATGMVSITVTGRNDAPIANNNSYTANEDTVLSGNDVDIAPRNQQGQTTPANFNDDGVLVNDIEIDNNDVFEVVSARTIVPGMNVAVWNTQAGDVGYGNLGGADANRANRAPNFSGTITLADIIGQPGGHFPNDTILPGTANNTEQYAVFITGILRVTTAGLYTFGTFSDDASRIKIDLNQNGTLADDANVVTQNGCCSDMFGQATLAVGDYQFEAMYTEGGGGDFGEFFYAPGNETAFNANFKLIGDGSSGISTFRPNDSILSGTLGTLGNGAATFTTPLGASVTLNDNGTFTYNPTGSATLQALNSSQSLVDSFSYTATDNQTIFTPAVLNYGVWNQQAGETIGGTFATADTARASRPANFTGTISQADVFGNNSNGHYGVNNVLPGTANNTENYAVYINGVLRVTVGGMYTFGTFSDDNSRIRIDLNQNGNPNDDANIVTQGSCCGDVFGQVNLAPGDYAFEAMYTEGGGGDFGEFFYAPGSQSVWGAPFRLIGDNSGPILGGSMQPTRSTATVNITVNGLNDAPVANDDSPAWLPGHTVSENATLTVTAAMTPGILLETYRDGSIGAAMPTADAARANLLPFATGTTLLADITDPEGHFPPGNFANNQPFPGDVLGADDNAYAVFYTGYLQVINPGTYTFGSSTDDNSRIRIDLDQDGILEGALGALGGTEAHPGGGTVMWQPGCCGNVFGAPVTLAAGFYRYEMVYTEGGGGSSGEFFYAPGSHTAFNASFRLIGDSSQGIASFRVLAGLMANDTDVDNGDTITVVPATITSANGATVTTLANGSFAYNPATSLAAQVLTDGQTLTDTFVYTLRDAANATDTATVTVIVNGVSDPVFDRYTVNEDNPANGIDLTVPAGTGVLANDALPGNPAFEVIRAQSTNLTGVIGTLGDGSATVTTTAGGTVVISDNGSFTYDQNGVFNSLPQGQTASDSFTYVVGGAVSPATIATNSSAGAFTVSNTDLLQGLTPVVTGTPLGGQEGTSSNPAVLSNGTFGPAALPDAAALAQTVSIGNNTTLTYTLDTTTNPLGYDISQIHTYSGWRDAGRDNQDYTVEYEQVGSPGVWTSFTPAAISFAPGTPPSGQVSITSPTGFLATGVSAVRFVFGNQENGYVGYRELDVIGTPRVTTTVTFNIVGQNDAPTAEANGPYNINLGQNLALSSVGSSDVDTGTVLSYGWDFNLDNVIDFTTASQTPTVPWATLQTLTPPMGAGSYTIRLTVGDGITTTTDTATLNISDNFVYNPVQDGVADGYLLILNPAQTIIEIRDTATNTLLVSVPKAGTNQVTFNGTNDNDTLTIDYTNTTPIPALNGVTFTGGAGTNGLVLRNGTVTTVTENYVTDNNGTTNIDGRVVSYTGLTPITDSLTAANRVFNLTGGNETVTLQNLVAGTTLQIDSTIGAITAFNKPTDSLTINLATGSTDTLNLTSATLMGNVTVAGSDGNDTVNVNGAVNVTAGTSLPGLVSVTAGTINFAGGSITTVNNVNLTAAGAISTTTTAVDITAVNLNASAATGINLDTAAATITATNSGAGAINIDETDSVTLQNLTTASGTITFTTTSIAATHVVTVENVNSGAQNTSITLAHGNLVSGAGDAGVADIVANQLTLQLNTQGTTGHFIGVSAANRLEIDVNQLQANIANGTNNSAWIVNTAGNLTMTNSSLAATGTTVFDVLVQNGSLLSIVDNVGDARAVQVILAVTGAGSTIGLSAAAPFEVNAATTTAGALVSAATAGGAADHIWLRDVADNFPVGVINAGLADVTLVTTVGSIIDNVLDTALDITSARLVMSATAGIGNGANGNLETQAGSLEATGGTGGVFLANTGNLTIGGITAAVGVSATGGDIVVSTAGSLSVNENVTATGAGTDVTLSTVDAAAAGQDLSLAAGVTVSSAAGTITLSAGDNFTLTATSNLSAPTGTITLNIDSGNADPNGASLTIPTGVVLTATGATFNAANPGAATDVDTFNFAPQLSTPIVVNAFNPLVSPGDVLNLNLTGATGNTLAIDGNNDGTYTFTNRASVEYNSIEDVNAVGGSYDLVLNMPGFGGAGNFTVRRSAPAVGTDLEIVNNSTGTVIFSGDIALITSLRAIGTTGADALTVDDVNGLPTFDTLLTPTFVFPDNPNGVGSPRLYFDGAAEPDTLNFQLTEAGTTQVYAIGNGTGPGSGDGEIQTSNTAGRNLVAYFTNFGNDGSQVNRSGAAAGSLTILGDAAGNTINVQANISETRVDPVGYTPFDFSGNNYNALVVNGVTGGDTLDLVSLGSSQTNNAPITLNGGTENDTIRVRSTSGSTGLVSLNGNAGNDLFQLFDTAPTVDNIAAQVIVDGSDGNVGGNTDTLVIVDSADPTADNVLITAVSPGTSADYGVEGINGVAGTDVILRNIDELSYTATSGNDTLDTRLVSTVPPHDLSVVTVNGWLGADQFLLFTSDQAGGTGAGVTPNGMASGVATINLNGDAPGNPNGGDGNDTFGETAPGIIGTGSGNVGLAVPDTVRGIRPSASTGININGGQPTGPALPTGDVIGDTLNLDVSGLPGGSALILPTLGGSVTTGGFQPLTYAQIEDINLIINNQLINVQMGDVFVRGTAGADLIQFMRAGLPGDPNRTRTRVNTLVVDYTLTGKTVTYAGGDNDYITQANVVRPAEMYGEAGNDYISGATGNDYLVGGLDSDQINAGAGDNVVWGDDAPTIPSNPAPQDLEVGGDDVLSALGGNDVFYGGGGNDQVSAGGGNDYANGGQGDDTLGGHEGDDRLYGGLGNDILSGGAGNDLLSGGDGDDQLIGTTGNDVLIGGNGVDAITGDDGNDLIVSGSVANENSIWSSVASTATYGAPTYSLPSDNDAALLTLLSQWGSSSNRGSIDAITHDGVDDDIFGGTGDDDISWETIDILDDFPAMAPADFNAFGMGSDERFGPM